MSEDTRPIAYVTNKVVMSDAMLEYLDDLRASGTVNMFGAVEYLEAAFGLDRQTARRCLMYWMETFGREDR